MQSDTSQKSRPKVYGAYGFFHTQPLCFGIPENHRHLCLFRIWAAAVVLLAVFEKFLAVIRTDRYYGGFEKPRRFEIREESAEVLVDIRYVAVIIVEGTVAEVFSSLLHI